MENKLSKLSDDEIKTILNESKSFSECINKFGYKCTNGSGAYTNIKIILKRRNIEIPKYNYFGLVDGVIIKKRNDDEIYCLNSTYPRQKLKEKIKKNNLIEYKCSNCGLTNEWNNKKLSLQLEHKNGINDDNRLENLTFLCPNCHSQTDTYAGKNSTKSKKIKKCKKTKQKKEKTFCSCGNKKSENSNMCLDCYKKTSRKVDRPNKELLHLDVNEFGYRGTGRKYGVSDNTIRKWLK